MSELYLVHHGILVQKWGVRRYQDKDGSLTAAGRERYETGEFKAKDVRIARKAIRKNGKNGENYNKAVNEAQTKLKKVVNNNGNDAAYDKAFLEGKRAIQKGLLMDAGYSKEKAEKGVVWLNKHGWNLTFTDTHPLHDAYSNDYETRKSQH